jgi:glycosyltransferase involved in cell wall biosynthesis
MATSNQVCVWLNYPSPYQTEFLESLNFAGALRQVIYYEPMPEARVQLGWTGGQQLLPYETRVANTAAAFDLLVQHRDVTHIFPGYGSTLIRSLVRAAIRDRIRWFHWSEPVAPGWRKYAFLPLRMAYGQVVNRFACGAFGIGDNALDDFASWGIRANKRFLLPYSRSAETPINRIPKRKSPVIFGYAGVLNKRKAIDVVLLAFAGVMKQFPQSTLRLIGRDESAGDFSRLAQELGVAARTEFVGALPETGVRKALASVDVFVFPSRFDGWGVALQEAALAGCALISTPTCGAARHLVIDGASGFVVAPGCVAETERAMLYYASNAEKAAEHGLTGQNLALDFTPETNVRRLLQAVNRSHHEDGSPV